MNAKNTGSDERPGQDVSAAINAGETAPEAAKGKEPVGAYRKIGEWWKDRGFTRTLEVLIAIATAVSASVAYVQWEAMELSNAESRRSADATVAAVLESKRQFEVSRKDAAGDADEDKRRFEATLAETKRQAEASRAQSEAAATASLDLARKSLEESRRALEVSQRASLAIETVTPYPLAADTAGTIRFELKNNGASDAVDVASWAYWQITPRQSFEGKPLAAETTSTLIIPPQEIYPFEMKGKVDAQSAERIQAIRDGRLHFYVYACTRYHDTFRTVRRVFCLEHQADGEGWGPCPVTVEMPRDCRGVRDRGYPAGLLKNSATPRP